MANEEEVRHSPLAAAWWSQVRHRHTTLKTSQMQLKPHPNWHTKQMGRQQQMKNNVLLYLSLHDVYKFITLNRIHAKTAVVLYYDIKGTKIIYGLARVETLRKYQHERNQKVYIQYTKTSFQHKGNKADEIITKWRTTSNERVWTVWSSYVTYDQAWCVRSKNRTTMPWIWKTNDVMHM